MRWAKLSIHQTREINIDGFKNMNVFTLPASSLPQQKTAPLLRMHSQLKAALNMRNPPAAYIVRLKTIEPRRFFTLYVKRWIYIQVGQSVPLQRAD